MNGLRWASTVGTCGILWAAVAFAAPAPPGGAAAPATPGPPPVAPADGAPTPCGPAVAGMACIPGGPFLRGRDDGPENERPQQSVHVDPFYMDLYEVTYPEYQACVKAKACRKGGPHYKGFSDARQPIVGVSWFGAREYCNWRGGRLPTEAEWEKAARGTDGRRYPWGDEKATCERAIIKDARLNGCRTGKTWPVGSRPAAIHGLYDMAGNAWEWTADWYANSYAACGADCAGPNPKGPCGGADACPGRRYRVVRGGSWFWTAMYATTSWRRRHLPANDPIFHHFGFRCARDAAPDAPGRAPRP